jgi:hypothetical protein
MRPTKVRGLSAITYPRAARAAYTGLFKVIAKYNL